MPPLQVRDLPQETYERLQRCAEREHRSLAQQTTWIIECFLDAYEAGQGSATYRYDAASQSLTPIASLEPSTIETVIMRLSDLQAELRRERRRHVLREIEKMGPVGDRPTMQEIIDGIREDRDSR